MTTTHHVIPGDTQSGILTMPPASLRPGRSGVRLVADVDDERKTRGDGLGRGKEKEKEVRGRMSNIALAKPGRKESSIAMTTATTAHEQLPLDRVLLSFLPPFRNAQFGLIPSALRSPAAAGVRNGTDDGVLPSGGHPDVPRRNPASKRRANVPIWDDR